MSHKFVVHIMIYQWWKGVDYRCVTWGITRNDAINMLNNSKLDDKGSLLIWILVQIKYLLK